MGRKKSNPGEAGAGEGAGEEKAAKKKRKKTAKEKTKENAQTEKGPKPLNAWAEAGPAATEVVVVRCDVFSVFVDNEAHQQLVKLAKVQRILIELENERRRKIFESCGEIIGKGGYKKAYSLYAKNKDNEQGKTIFTEVLRSNAITAALQAVDAAWDSFKKLLEEKREGRLPEWMDEPHPPGTRKKKEKRLTLLLHRCNYRLDLGKGELKLMPWGFCFRISGTPRWLVGIPKIPLKVEVLGARLTLAKLVYDDVKRKWYLHTPVEVKLTRRTTEMRRAAVDVGIKRPVACVVEARDGEKGVALLYRWTFEKERRCYDERTALLQSLIDVLRNCAQLESAQPPAQWAEGAELAHGIKVINELLRRLTHLKKRVERSFRVKETAMLKNLAKHLARRLAELGVTELYIGEPKNIAQDKREERTSKWPYRRLINAIALACENFGIAVYAVDEVSTSKICSRCGAKVKREPRGRIVCENGHAAHSDLNAAMNILIRAGGGPPERYKILSFTAAARGVIERKRKQENAPGARGEPAGRQTLRAIGGGCGAGSRQVEAERARQRPSKQFLSWRPCHPPPSLSCLHFFYLFLPYLLLKEFFYPVDAVVTGGCGLRRCGSRSPRSPLQLSFHGGLSWLFARSSRALRQGVEGSTRAGVVRLKF